LNESSITKSANQSHSARRRACFKAVAVARERGELRSAQNYHSRALAILEQLAPNSQGVAASLSNLGNVAHERGELQSARNYYGLALAIFERLAPNSLDTVEVLGNLGDLASRERRFADARSLFERAIKVIESQRSKTPSTQARALFLARYATPFTGLLRTHLQLNDLPAAFAISERARARSLVELLAERRLDLRSDAPADLLKQQDELDQKRSATYSALAKLDSGKDSKRIEKLQGELGKYDLQQRELAAQIRRASPKLASLQYPEPLNLSRTQAAIEPGTLLLSYYVDDQETYLFAVTKDSLTLFRLPITATDLNKQITEFQNQVSVQRLGNPTQEVHKQGQQLYQTLIGPAQGLANQAKRVLVCPDGPLQALPFAALGRRFPCWCKRPRP
jgi:tetratricopeptide (TPR) repeat protein